MKKVLLTGADGFIGSHLTHSLLKNGYKVMALSYYNSFNNYGWLDFINVTSNKNLKIISGDITDSSFVNSISKNVDYIIHLASLISIPYSFLSPNVFVNTNITGTLNLLEAASSNKIKKFIHTSTSEVYGTAQYTPIDEKHPLNPQSPYAATKVGADSLVNSYFFSKSVPVVTLRPFNVFGPRQSARAIIPTIISQCLKKTKSLNLGNLNSIRDFTYVEDTVDAYIKTLRSENSKIFGETINIGSGYPITIEDLVKKIIKLTNYNGNLKIQKQRLRPHKSEVEVLHCDNKKAKKLLQWQIKETKEDYFDKNLKQTINWFDDKNNLNRYKHTTYNI